MKYRSELNGLRAIAIIPVLFFHAGFDWASGGFIGVDIFFVISGFLISSIILEKLNSQEKFSFFDFLTRRFWRLAPALYFVCFIAAIPAYFMLLPLEFKEFGGSLWSSAVFGSNIWFFDKVNYFRPVSKDALLLHTWSLGAEMQFYFFLAFFVPFALKTNWIKPIQFLVIITVLSFIAALFAWPNKPEANFFLPPSRIWEFTLGALIAFWPKKTEMRKSVCEFFSISGIVLIVASFLLLSENSQHPGIVTLVPVAGTVLIILFSNQSTLCFNCLSFTPMVFIGLISYSLYLWHQPIMAIVRIVNQEPLDNIQFAVVVFISFFLAVLTWRFVETPLRYRSGVDWQRRRLVLLPSVILVATIGISIEISDGMPGRLPVSALDTLNDPMAIPSNAACIKGISESWEEYTPCVYNKGGSRVFVVVGDSHANALTEELALVLKDLDVSLVELSMNSCPPLKLLARYSEGAICAEFIEKSRQAIVDLGPEAIIFAARWNMYQPNFSRMYGAGYNTNVFEDQSTSDPHYLKFLKEFEDLVEQHQESGTKSIAISTVPTHVDDVPKLMAGRLFLNFLKRPPVSIAIGDHFDRDFVALNAFAELQDKTDLIFVNSTEVLCDSSLSKVCLAEVEGKSLYRDDDHINRRGAKYLAEYIAENLRKAGILNALE